MPFVLCYTKKGDPHYSDVNDSMHLALSYDGKKYQPLRNNTGILFPEADMNDGTMPGCTKTLLYPWLFRFKDGNAGAVAVRRNRNAADPLSIGSVMIYKSSDFVHYELLGFLKLDDYEIKNPRLAYDNAKGKYRIEWETEKGIFGGYSDDLKTVSEVSACSFSFSPSDCFGIADALPGNVIEVSDKEADYIDKMLGLVYNTEVKVPSITINVGSPLNESLLPKATCVYNDGSTHDMRVDWDKDALAGIDTSKPGEYTVNGKVIQKIYPVPFIEHASDPCIFKYNDKYYFTSSNKQVVLRESDTIDGLMQAEKIIIRDDPNASFWAQELHIINGVPYIFTSLCENNKWYTVQSILLRCDGEINNPADWSEPIYCVKKDGSLLNKDKGICLDMTYFEIDGVHYVSWSNRDMHPENFVSNENGDNGPADIYIATINPDEPWKLTSDPICICRPIYGWDRIETEVDEGPYILRRGDDIFLTFSGASVGTVYCVGLLKAKYGSDLLDPVSWTEVPYPVLTKESVPGQYGPGHNNFIKDPDNEEDDLIVLLYRPLDEWNTPDAREKNPRHAAVRRVHWNASGYPNLEMTPEQELNPDFANVTLKITVK